MTFETQYHHWRLKNGLRVIVAYRPWANTFAACLAFRVGWRHDPSECVGITHLLEHLAFRGANDELAQRLADQGLYVNATTDWEQTHFISTGHRTLFEDVLPLYRNILCGVPTDEQTTRSELEIVAHELVAMREEPAETELRKVTAAILGDARFGRPVPKSIANLNRLPTSKLADFARCAFAPSNAVLVVVSPHQPQQLQRQLADHLEVASGSAAQHPPPMAKARQRPLIVRRYLGSHAMVATYHVYRPRNRHPLTATAMLSDVLGGGPHSLLFARIRREQRMGYEVGSDVIALNDCVVLNTHAIVHRRHITQALEAMVTALHALRTAGLSQEMFDSCRVRMIRGFDALEDDPRELCDWLAAEALGGADEQLSTPQGHRAQLEAATLARMNYIAADVLRPQLQTAVLFGPVGWIKQLRASRILRRLSTTCG